ncbi:tetratricopeptide repeat protein [Bowmanella dokdonensis]|uniref:Tetratricopeptide repeat protein n=1 Tax=Bowmanella dokdonensis TaxID=751969 RepID=A0A939DQ90_9ALTE|nr:tetratricopeptide repeat protein [Bowmanella dokdonensis]MBN7826807.1 hypothetical protein [Bowmanella dokdonensis]
MSPSLAVLPYSNLSEGGEFSYFARGLTETITDSLSRVSGLKLIALASASNTGESDQDAQAMGDKLGVAQVVTGSVEKIGEQVRVHTRLVRVADGKSLWSAVHERQVDNVFAIHDEISQFIVSRLSELMAEQYQLPGSPSAGTVTQQDSSAYLLVLQANALRQGGSGQQLTEAQQLYRQALQLKPDYPQALIGLAAVIRARTTLGDIPREAGFPEALSLAHRAVLLAPDLADAFVQIGEIQYRHFWDFKQADASFQQALAAAPGSATAHAAYGRFLSKVGRHRAAIQQARTALELDPLSPGALASLIIRLIRVNELDQARQLLEQMKQRYPGDANIPWLETNWHIRHQSYNEALQWIALEELAYLRQSLSAMALHFLDRKGQAQKTLNELIATDAEGAAFQIAEVYAQWQQLDLAFVWLDKAFSQGDPGLSELYSSVNLHNLYEDERFFALAARLGLPVLSAQALRQP